MAPHFAPGAGGADDGGGPAAFGDLAGRLAGVWDAIAAAGADPAQVRIVAVTKGFGAGAVRAALAAGLHDVGENYAQELQAKAVEVRDPDLRWHFLGSPQRNKVAGLAPLVALWQGVDRPEVLQAVARRRPGAAVLVEVNVGEEPGKHGCRPADAAGLVALGADLGLEVRGLMTVAPADRQVAGRCFAALASLGGRLGLRELSMGMSDDFDLAVAEGATMVRLGRALFGPRPGPAAVRR